MTRWPDLFAAGVTHAGMSDLACFFAETEPWMAAASVTEYGDPDTEAELLRLLSPLTHLAAVRTPMLLIHGLADDNVFVANSLRLSAGLFEARKWHELVLIPNATHLTRSTAVTENILRVQLDFLRRTLGA